MSSAAIFDDKAAAYDKEFTDSYVGIIQRKRIHEFVKQHIEPNGSINVLELNAGTGADVSFLSEYGKLLVTDVSTEMLRVTKQKYPHIETNVLDLNSSIDLSGKFDLIFSNFGGFNCIDEKGLIQLNKELAGLLNPGGKLVVVFMHKWSLMEFLYFLCRFNFKKAFRRLNGKSEFKGSPIWYYSRGKVKNIFSRFQLLEHQPVGLLLSGEYMNKWGQRFNVTETRNKGLSWVFGADHMAYMFELK